MSKRESIRDAIINNLRTIKTANGYRNDVKNVTKYLSDFINIRSFPLVAVVLGEETFNKLSEIAYEKTLTLYIIGFTQTTRDVNDTGKIIDANESLIDDVLKCLNINESNLCSNQRLLRANIVYVAPYIQLNDQGLINGTIEIQYQVTYVE